ncbi:MAG: energy transducer TonB [Steroidobacteraceae bacterium]
MGICRSSDSLWRRLTRRGGGLAFILGAHLVAVLVFAQMKLGERNESNPVPVHVTLLNEPRTQPPPPQPQVKLADLRTPDIALPTVETPLVEPPPAPAAITVTRPSPVQQVAPPAEEGPLLVDQVEYLSKVPLTYPPMAKRAREQGTVLLRVLIGPDGNPLEVLVHRSSGHSHLDRAARDAVMHYRFKPYRENGVARTVQVLVPIEFTLTVRTASRS